MKKWKHLSKRVLAAILAVSMMLSTGIVPAFAADLQAEATVTVPEPLALYDFEDFTAGENDTLTDGERVLKLESEGGTKPALYQDAGHGQVLKLYPAAYSQRAFALLPANPFAGRDIEKGLTLNFWTNSQGDVVRERCLIDFEVAPAVNGKRAGTFAVNQLSSYWNTTDQNGTYTDFRYDNTIGLDTLNEWKMITVVLTKTGVTFYTNGEVADYARYGSNDFETLLKDVTGTSGLVTDPGQTNVRIGASLATYWSCANALIDDIAFYGEALTQEQIKSLYVVKDALRAAVAAEKADDLKAEDFSEVTWNAYAEALANAETILAKDNATQAEIDAALETLLEARKNLALANKVVSLEVTPPTKTQYFVGDALDTTGLVVTAIHEDGTQSDVTSFSEVSGYNANVAGTQEVTVTYKELTAAFEVTVSYPFVKKYEAEHAVLTLPAKTVYRADASGSYKVGTIDNANATVTFTVGVPEDGTYRVDVAADGEVSAFPNPSHKYWINGDSANAKVINYTKSTVWDTWFTYPIEMELKAGENTITFSHSGVASSYSELDYIMVYCADPKFTITLDGVALDGFDMDVQTYEADVADLSAIPEVGVAFEGDSDAFVVDIQQATKDRPFAAVTVKSADGTYAAEYQVNFFGPDAFENPLINFAADPNVAYEDGYYYYVRVKNDKSIWVTKSDDLTRIGKVEPVCVYQPSGDEPAYQLWAPEIHYLDGHWYIYYAACAVNDNVHHRMYVIRSKTSDAQGEYEFVGKLAPTTDNWAIDQTVLEYNGKLYAIWSGWHYTTNVDQRIYIAEMSDPTTIVGERVELSLPEYGWEQQGGSPYINEGPQIAIAPDGTVNIVYSASGSWSDYYCLGMLTLKKGGDPMNAEDWIKSDEPVFEKNNVTTFSTGHACFVSSPDGTETYLVYHATRGSGDGWAGRGARMQRVYWNEDGTPYIGIALDYNGRVNKPSGTPEREYVKLEAENAELYGSANVVATYNSSAGKKVAGITTASDYAVFTFDVEQAGTYKLYLGASTTKDTSLSVKVNDGEAVTETIPAFGQSDTNKYIGDNWFGYELEVVFNEGENTVTVAGTGTAVALDYVEYTLLEVLDSENVRKVEALIDAIGEVTLDSKEAIDAARAAYDALTEEEKTQVGNYQTLLDAEERYANLLLEQKANEVEALIDAIGEVTLDSGEAIDAARTAYDALTEEQKAQITNYQTLLDAEHDYVLLLAEDYAVRAEEAAAAAQKAYEDALAAYEKAKAEIAEDKTAAEEAKKEAEAAKAAAEEAQAKAEAARKAAEDAKTAAEGSRDEAAAEALKAAAEAAKAAESAQLAAEYAAKTAEALAMTQAAQAAAEAAQKEAEEAQKAAEEAQKAAEEAQKEAAEKRKEAEEAAEAAKKAQEAAELANAKFLALYELTVLTRDINTDELNAHELAQLEETLAALIAEITAAETQEEVQAALDEAKEAIDAALNACASTKFTDVEDAAWYHEAIDYVLANGIMNGVDDTAFAPNATTNRAMLATILYRAAGEPDVTGLENPFTDVPADKYYTNAVIWAADKGIVTGRDKDTFDPDAAVTRQEMVTMLWRYAGYPESEADLSGYTDAESVKDFAKTAMAWAVETGVLTGMTDTTLAPEGTATRAQIATVLMRYLEG